MRTDLFDFPLPPERIALRPARPRDAARLLVVRPGAPFEDRVVRDLPELLRAGDQLVVNDTRVIPASSAWPAHRTRARNADRGQSREAPRRLALECVRETGQAARRRRYRALRRRGQGLLSRPARCERRGERRGRRGHLRVFVPRSGARPGDRRARQHAVAAVHRVAPRAGRRRPRRLPDAVRARRRLGRGADRGPAFH